MHLKSFAILTSLTLLGASATVRADEAKPAKVTYKEVSAIFQNRCNGCHNNDKKKGGLVLDNYGSALEGGGSGAVIERGDSANSRLYLLVAHEEEPAMPPNQPKLPDAELALIRAWIDAGAPESAGDNVAMAAKPKLDFKLDPSAIGKPQGPPAMPEAVSTEPVVVTSRPNAITALATSPWAPLVAVSGFQQVLLYNTATQRLVGVLPFPEGDVHTLKFTRDGAMILAGGGQGGQSGRVVCWDVKTGQRLFEVGKEYDIVLAADISPDRSLVALGGPSKVLRVYNTSDGELVYENKKHTEWVTSVAFSPDGVLLASGDRNGGLIVWEGMTGREFYDLRGHGAMVTDLSWRLDSNVLASSSEDGTVRLWAMQNGNQIKSWGAHGGGAQSVRFAKDGRLVSTGRDRVTKLWDQNGAAKLQFEAFGDIGLQAAFTFDDSAIVAGDWTGEIRIWEAKEGKRIGNLAANPAPIAVRLEKTSQELATAQAAADAATQELAKLQETVATQSAAVTSAQQALTQAQAAASAAAAKLAATEKAATDARNVEQTAAVAYSKADFERSRATTMRNDLLTEMREKAEAARLSAAARDVSHNERDRQIAARAEAALAEVTKRAEVTLPQLSAMIDAANAARATYDQTTAARIAAEAPLAQLRLETQKAAATVPPQQAALDAANNAKAAAEKAVVDKTPVVQELTAKANALKAEADALAAEKKTAEAAGVAAATASASR